MVNTRGCGKKGRWNYFFSEGLEWILTSVFYEPALFPTRDIINDFLTFSKLCFINIGVITSLGPGGSEPEKLRQSLWWKQSDFSQGPFLNSYCQETLGECLYMRIKYREFNLNLTWNSGLWSGNRLTDQVTRLSIAPWVISTHPSLFYFQEKLSAQHPNKKSIFSLLRCLSPFYNFLCLPVCDPDISSSQGCTRTCIY